MSTPPVAWPRRSTGGGVVLAPGGVADEHGGMSIGSALLGAVLAVASVTNAGVGPVASPGSSLASEHPVSEASRPGRWGWPLDPRPEVVQRFDPPDRPWLPGHRGVDLAAAAGQSVVAPTDGMVTWSGVIAGRGVVVVSHSGGLRSTFEPVTGAPATGTPVTRGARVGSVAATPGHCAPRTCVHWGVLRGETYLDPMSFVSRARVVLLPL
jgi:murein DD-endopeptidase MepM/ murein hydrolase activator NlpD